MRGGAGSELTLLDELLAEQRSLTAVERFAQKHAGVEEPVQARYYRDLIPLSAPGVGEQYAFEVDLGECSGCKACVTACHSMNGLDEGESWRDVGVLFGGTVIEPAQQTVTTACHHCVDPACANGCPVLAYDKDEVTGIVRHLDDQCIGCRYCELKCPYDVPKYNAGRGIVRKCDMCHGRLAEGEAPACVQSCPNEAIKIRVVDRVSVMERNEVERALVPGAFDSRYTQPTTVYANRRTNGAVMRPADDGRLEPEHGHYPLVWMLVMTQLAAGVLAGAMWGGPGVALAGLAVLVLGLGGSVLHLGRPG
ncbi:MAG: 4Fe-4S dicluster domain-containing protein, partial [Verrucomicrobiota bacterium]